MSRKRRKCNPPTHTPFRSRCTHPAQQHGRRMRDASFEIPTSIRRVLVSDFFADSTQQIHSFRASGVISSQSDRTFWFARIALRKSFGSLCTVPLGRVCFIHPFHQTLRHESRINILLLLNRIIYANIGVLFLMNPKSNDWFDVHCRQSIYQSLITQGFIFYVSTI